MGTATGETAIAALADSDLAWAAPLKIESSHAANHIAIAGLDYSAPHRLHSAPEIFPSQHLSATWWCLDDKAYSVLDRLVESPEHWPMELTSKESNN